VNVGTCVNRKHEGTGVVSIACTFNILTVPMFQVRCCQFNGAFNCVISGSIKEGKFLDRVTCGEIFKTSSAPCS
jgi:hypothetical protein